MIIDERMQRASAILAALMAASLFCGGCAANWQREEAHSPVPLSVAAGQGLVVRVDGKNDVSAVVETSYVSALGEQCAWVRWPERAGAACLRDGVWQAVPAIAPAMPLAPEAR